MEEILDDTSLTSILAGISNSPKFRLLCKTICLLRSKYLARGIKHDLITEKIMSKIFNTKTSLAVNWYNLENTIEYHKIKNLVELDPKTIELALAIQQEIGKMKKKKKQDKSANTVDDMLDIFQFRLEANLNLDKTSSSCSSDSPPSDPGDNYASPEYSGGLSYYDQTKHNFYGDNVHNNGYVKENLGKRKPVTNMGLDYEDDCYIESKGELFKKVKVPYKIPENSDKHRSTISTFLANEMRHESVKRGRENDNGTKIDKLKSFKL